MFYEIRSMDTHLTASRVAGQHGRVESGRRPHRGATHRSSVGGAAHDAPGHREGSTSPSVPAQRRAVHRSALPVGYPTRLCTERSSSRHTQTLSWWPVCILPSLAKTMALTRPLPHLNPANSRRSLHTSTFLESMPE